MKNEKKRTRGRGGQKQPRNKSHDQQVRQPIKRNQSDPNSDSNNLDNSTSNDVPRQGAICDYLPEEAIGECISRQATGHLEANNQHQFDVRDIIDQKVSCMQNCRNNRKTKQQASGANSVPKSDTAQHITVNTMDSHKHIDVQNKDHDKNHYFEEHISGQNTVSKTSLSQVSVDELKYKQRSSGRRQKGSQLSNQGACDTPDDVNTVEYDKQSWSLQGKRTKKYMDVEPYRKLPSDSHHEEYENPHARENEQLFGKNIHLDAEECKGSDAKYIVHPDTTLSKEVEENNGIYKGSLENNQNEQYSKEDAEFDVMHNDSKALPNYQIDAKENEEQDAKQCRVSEENKNNVVHNDECIEGKPNEKHKENIQLEMQNECLKDKENKEHSKESENLDVAQNECHEDKEIAEEFKESEELDVLQNEFHEENENEEQSKESEKVDVQNKCLENKENEDLDMENKCTEAKQNEKHFQEKEELAIQAEHIKTELHEKLNAMQDEHPDTEPHEELDAMHDEHPETDPHEELNAMHDEHPETDPHEELDAMHDEHPETEPHEELDAMQDEHPETDPHEELDAMEDEHPETEPHEGLDAMEDDHPENEPLELNAMQDNHPETELHEKLDTMQHEYPKTEPHQELDAMQDEHPETEQQEELDAMQDEHPETEQQEELDAMQDKHPETEQQEELDAMQDEHPETEPYEELDAMQNKHSETDPHEELDAMQNKHSETDPHEELDAMQNEHSETEPHELYTEQKLEFNINQSVSHVQKRELETVQRKCLGPLLFGRHVKENVELNAKQYECLGAKQIEQRTKQNETLYAVPCLEDVECLVDSQCLEDIQCSEVKFNGQIFDNLREPNVKNKESYENIMEQLDAGQSELHNVMADIESDARESEQNIRDNYQLDKENEYVMENKQFDTQPGKEINLDTYKEIDVKMGQVSVRLTDEQTVVKEEKTVNTRELPVKGNDQTVKLNEKQIVKENKEQAVQTDEEQAVQPDEEQAVQPDEEQAVQPDEEQAVQPDEEKVVQPDEKQTVQQDEAQTIQPDKEEAIQPDVEQAVQPDEQQAVKPSEELAIKPSEKLTVKSSEKLDVKPSDELAIKSSDELAIKPSEKLTVKPSEELDVEPSEELAIKPSEKLTVKPSEELDVEPSEELAIKPREELAIKPSEELAVKPNEELAIKPSEELAVKPSNELAIKPSEELAIKPSEELAVKPSEEEAIKPSEEEAIKPSEEETIKESERQAIKPSEEEAIKPTEEEAIKENKKQAIKPSEEEAIMPSKEEAIKETKKQAIKPSKEEAIKPSEEEAIMKSRKQAIKPSKKEAIKPSEEEAIKPSEEEAIKPSEEEAIKESEEQTAKESELNFQEHELFSSIANACIKQDRSSEEKIEHLDGISLQECDHTQVGKVVHTHVHEKDSKLVNKADCMQNELIAEKEDKEYDTNQEQDRNQEHDINQEQDRDQEHDRNQEQNLNQSNSQNVERMDDSQNAYCNEKLDSKVDYKPDVKSNKVVSPQGGMGEHSSSQLTTNKQHYRFRGRNSNEYPMPSQVQHDIQKSLEPQNNSCDGRQQKIDKQIGSQKARQWKDHREGSTGTREGSTGTQEDITSTKEDSTGTCFTENDEAQLQKRIYQKKQVGGKKFNTKQACTDDLAEEHVITCSSNQNNGNKRSDIERNDQKPGYSPNEYQQMLNREKKQATSQVKSHHDNLLIVNELVNKNEVLTREKEEKQDVMQDIKQHDGQQDCFGYNDHQDNKKQNEHTYGKRKYQENYQHQHGYPNYSHSYGNANNGNYHKQHQQGFNGSYGRHNNRGSHSPYQQQSQQYKQQQQPKYQGTDTPRKLFCSFCNEDYNRSNRMPRLLHCQHSLCTECAQKLKVNTSIFCPYCKWETWKVFNINKLKCNFIILKCLPGQSDKPIVTISRNNGTGNQGCVTKQSFMEEKSYHTSQEHAKSSVMTVENERKQSRPISPQNGSRREMHTASPHNSQCLEFNVRPSFHCANCEKWVCDKCGKVDHNENGCVLIPLKETLAQMKQKHENDANVTCKSLSGSTKELKYSCDQVDVFLLSMRAAVECFEREQKDLEKALQDGIQMERRLKDSVVKLPACKNLPESLAGLKDIEDSCAASQEWISHVASRGSHNDQVKSAAKTLISLMLYSIRRYTTEDGKINQIVACHKGSSSTRFSSLTVRGGRVHLHCLTSSAPVKSPQKLPLECFKSCLDHTSSLAFFDLSWSGSTHGRIYIRMTGDTMRGRQFLMLCTGEMGPSFCNTNFHRVWWKGHPGEHIWGGDVKHGDGSGDAMLINGFDIEHATEISRSVSITAGLVAGRYEKKNPSSIFRIYTKDAKSTMEEAAFGQVEFGLHIIQKAVNHNNIQEVIISDCGVVLEL